MNMVQEHARLSHHFIDHIAFEVKFDIICLQEQSYNPFEKFFGNGLNL